MINYKNMEVTNTKHFSLKVSFAQICVRSAFEDSSREIIFVAADSCRLKKKRVIRPIASPSSRMIFLCVFAVVTLDVPPTSLKQTHWARFANKRAHTYFSNNLRNIPNCYQLKKMLHETTQLQNKITYVWATIVKNRGSLTRGDTICRLSPVCPRVVPSNLLDSSTEQLS